MKRRDFLRIAGLSVVAAGAQGIAANTDKKRPSLLIIHTDEHNFRTLGCYRDTLSADQALPWGEGAVVKTPNIDSLASKGAICTKFYATTPVCSPSRAAFVSGKYPQNTPVVNNNVPLDDNIVTFAAVLSKAGYRTGYSGKWHLDGYGKPQWAPKRKFGFEDNRYMFNRGHWKKLTDTPEGPKVDTGEKPSYDVSGATPENFTTDWLADKTIQFITEQSDRPFCYMVSIPDPHGPDSVRAPYDAQFAKMEFAKPSTAKKNPDESAAWAKPKKGKTRMSQYFGMVKCIDDNVGRILGVLRKTRQLDNTIIVFTADHGDLCGEHGRHNKGVPLEASVKVPFIICYPPKIKAGTVVSQALGMVDFMPTILALMEIGSPDSVEGRDASGLLTGKADAGNWRDVTFIRGTGTGASWLAAVTARYKLILSPSDPPWLIDLKKDPDELKNVCSDPAYKEVARRLSGELIAYGKKFKDARIGLPKFADELEALSKNS